MNRYWITAVVMMIGAGGSLATWAGAFKCRQPDGSTIYQETACAADAAGEEVMLDPRPSGGGKARGKASDVTPEGQIKALEAERRKARQGRAKTADSKRRTPRDDPDRAKCAKHRAAVIRVRQKTKSAYRDREDRDYHQRMLEYHQALVERYCEKP